MYWFLKPGSSARRIVDMDMHIVATRVDDQWFIMLLMQDDSFSLVAVTDSEINQYRADYGVVEVSDLVYTDLTNATWDLHGVSYSLVDGVVTPGVIGEY